MEFASRLLAFTGDLAAKINPRLVELSPFLRVSALS
jgi:hypothetical protein